MTQTDGRTRRVRRARGPYATGLGRGFVALAVVLLAMLPAMAQVPDFMVGHFAITASPNRAQSQRGAVIAPDGVARFVVREEILPAERTTLLGDRWVLAGTDLVLAERVEPMDPGFHAITGANGDASTLPDEYYRPVAGGEPMGFLLHLAAMGYHGPLARDMLAVRGQEAGWRELVAAIGPAPSIALRLGAPGAVPLDGVVIVAPGRAEALSADGLSLDWGDGQLTFRAHPSRALLIGTATADDRLAEIFNAY